MNRPGGGEVMGAGGGRCRVVGCNEIPHLGSCPGLRVMVAREAGPEEAGPWQGWPRASGPVFRSLGPWVGQFRPGCKVQLGARPATGGEAPALRGRCPSWQD